MRPLFHPFAWKLFLVLPLVLATVSCGPDKNAKEEVEVKLDFDSCKTALLNRRTDQVMVYIPQNVRDYLDRLKASSSVATPAANSVTTSPSSSPGVDLLLQSALEKKVPADLRAGLTLDMLMQRISDKKLLNLHEVERITLGRVSVDGKNAQGQIYYQGTMTAIYLHFIKEGDVWKIDVMNFLPYAEILLQVDRAYTRQSEAQQVEGIVNKLPSL